METELKEIQINGKTYVLKGSENTLAETLDGLEYVLVRGDRSGVFVGYLESKDGREVVLRNVRRIWYWDGAASISQLAIDGVSKPQNCKFPAEVSRIKILDAIEILDVTEKAKKSIARVRVWQS